jgi:hypothetical protein
VADISVLSLRALRDQVQAGLREVVVVDDVLGLPSVMVYVPKFTIPAGAMLNGAWPAADMDVGGFLVDKYACSHANATPFAMGIGPGADVEEDDGNVPVSQPGRVAWTDVSAASAKVAARNRLIGARRCHLPTAREHAALLFLVQMLGASALRGNTAAGRDVRDDDTWCAYGALDPTTSSGRTLPGLGPASWGHCQHALGVADLLGNVWEWNDFQVNDTVYQHNMYARLDGAIDDDDTVIVLSGVEEVQHWPAADGVVYVAAEGANTAEWVRYAALVDGGSGNVTLTGVTRGASGAASAHGDDALVHCRVLACVWPGGMRATVLDNGLDNTSSPALVQIGTAPSGLWPDVLYGPGGLPVAVGDVLDCQGELMQVTAIDGGSVLVERGYNATTLAAHPSGQPIARLWSAATRSVVWVVGADMVVARYDGLVADGPTADMGLPSAVVHTGAPGVLGGDTVAMVGAGSGWLMRGGAYDLNGHTAQSGFAASFALDGVGLGRGPDVGFRCVLHLETRVTD